MAVPKNKVSKARRNTRNSANYKAAVVTLVECPSCHQKKQPHIVCPKCGVYDGRTVVSKEKKENK